MRSFFMGSNWGAIVVVCGESVYVIGFATL
jgi:hypothetical protein